MTEDVPFEAIIPAALEDAQAQNEAVAMIDASTAALEMLSDILPKQASEVERATAALSERFTSLAESAYQQGKLLDALIAASGTIDLEGKTLPISEFIALLNNEISDAVGKLLLISKKAMTMVYSMNDAIKNLQEIEGFSKSIQAITKQTHMLSLNATIEANRAGVAGSAFGVVANEVKALSQRIAALSANMSTRVGAITQSVSDEFGILQDIATTDMKSNLVAKETVDMLMHSLVTQGEKTKSAIQESSQSSQVIAKAVQSMVMELQFQDHNTQTTENAVSVLHECITVFRNIDAIIDSLAQNGEAVADPATMEEAIQAIASVIKLGEVRQQYMKVAKSFQGIEDREQKTASAESGDNIEFF